MLTSEGLYAACREALDPDSPTVTYSDAHYFTFRADDVQMRLSNYLDYFADGFQRSSMLAGTQRNQRIERYAQNRTCFYIAGLRTGNKNCIIARPRQLLEFLKDTYANEVMIHSLASPEKWDEVVVFVGNSYIADVSKHPWLNMVYDALTSATPHR